MRQGGKIVCGLFFFVLAGCISLPKESEERDQIAKKFEIRPDRAKIYIYRNKFVGGLFNYPIWVNDRLVGSVSSSTYQMLSVKEGKFNFRVAYGNEPQKAISIKGNNLYFVLVDTNIGLFSPHLSIEQQDSENGKEAVRSRELVKRHQTD